VNSRGSFSKPLQQTAARHRDLLPPPSSPIWSELADPFVGPAIRAETGTTYLTTVACAMAVATALVLGGAFSAFRRARNALR
jgi:hypothetical protein